MAALDIKMKTQSPNPQPVRCIFGLLSTVLIFAGTCGAARPSTTSLRSLQAPTNWSVPYAPSSQATGGSISGFSTRPLLKWQADRVGTALDLVQEMSPSTAAEIGQAIGATGPGNPNPTGDPDTELSAIVDDAFVDQAETADGQIGIDFDSVDSVFDLAITLIHENDHRKNLNSEGVDERINPEKIAENTGMPIELARLTAECNHAVIEWNASEALCDLDFANKTCNDAKFACLALTESDEIASQKLMNCNGMTLYGTLSGETHPAADAAKSTANSHGHTQADDCPACVKANNPPCTPAEEE